MHRTFATRALSVMLALWFAISIAEPQWLHACPMHDGVVATTSGAPSPHASHGAHAPHGAHHQHGGTQAPADASHCQCLGACSPGAAVLLSRVAELPRAEVRAIDAGAVLSPAEYIPVVRQRTLPPATAPPVL